MRGSMLGRVAIASTAGAIFALSACSKDDPVKPGLPALDTIPPAAITDLGAPASTANQIILVWTAPGDDESTGRAAQYDIRCSSWVIGSATWPTAYQIAGERKPKAAGLPDTFTVTGLWPGTEYYFAMKTADEAGNWSAQSNVAHRATLTFVDTIPPAAVVDLTVDHVTGQAANLAWTAPGDDGSIGTAVSYDIRYSISPISEGTWGSAAPATNAPLPHPAGSGETCLITGLSKNTTYYFALKATDDNLNESALSNVASATTSQCTFCWLPLGTGLDEGGTVASLVVFGDGMVAGGSFTGAGGIPAFNVASWDGASWTALGEGVHGAVRAFAVYGDRLLAAASPGAEEPASLRVWNGASWAPFPGIYSEDVLALVEYDGSLVAGGTFTSAGGVAASRIAIWNGSSWRELGAGVSGGSPLAEVRALAVYKGELVAAGRFTTAGSFAAANIARWNGADWIPLGSGLEGGASPCVDVLAVYGGRLIAGGSFTTAGGVSAANIAAWDGSAWSSLGSGVSGGGAPRVRALAESGGLLVAGGSFTTAGGASAVYVATWDGAMWFPLGSGLREGSGSGVHALADFGGNLIAGGEFTSSGDSTAVAIAVLAY